MEGARIGICKIYPLDLRYHVLPTLMPAEVATHSSGFCLKIGRIG